MTERLYVVIPTLWRYDLLERAIASARGAADDAHILAIDNGAQMPSATRAEKRWGMTHLYVPHENLGVAGSWNLGLREQFARGASWVLVMNDDVEVSAEALDEFRSLMAKGVNMTVGNEGVGMSCFAISRTCVERHGTFDENLYPAYIEDADFHRRMRLAGDEQVVINSTSIKHERSASIKRPDIERENARTWAENRKYYLEKWGDPLPDADLCGATPLQFETPFGDPELPLSYWKLDIERRERLKWRLDEPLP